MGYSTEREFEAGDRAFYVSDGRKTVLEVNVLRNSSGMDRIAYILVVVSQIRGSAGKRIPIGWRFRCEKHRSSEPGDNWTLENRWPHRGRFDSRG